MPSPIRTSYFIGIAVLAFASVAIHCKRNDQPSTAPLVSILHENPSCLSNHEIIELERDICSAGKDWELAKQIMLKKHYESLDRNIDLVWQAVLEHKAKLASTKNVDEQQRKLMNLDLSNRTEGAFCQRQIAWERIKAITYWHPGVTSHEALSKGRPFDFSGLDFYETKYRSMHKPTTRGSP